MNCSGRCTNADQIDRSASAHRNRWKSALNVDRLAFYSTDCDAVEYPDVHVYDVADVSVSALIQCVEVANAADAFALEQLQCVNDSVEAAREPLMLLMKTL